MPERQAWNEWDVGMARECEADETLSVTPESSIELTACPSRAKETTCANAFPRHALDGRHRGWHGT